MPTIRYVLVVLMCALTAPPLAAMNLLEVYEVALRSDPLLREAEANRLAALEAKPQARSALLPQIIGQGSQAQDESKGGNTFPQVNPNTLEIVQVNRSFETETDSETQWQLQLTQTVFRWDQWITLKQADKTVAQAEADYQAAIQDLMLRVSERYFDVLAAQDTLASADAAKEAIARQLEQAEKRFEVGLSAITDVQEAQAAYDQTVADVIAAKRSLASARELLRETTGEYFEELAKPGEGLNLAKPEPSKEDDWVNTAMDQNLSLVASRIAEEIARDEVKVRRTGHYPTVDLVASRSSFENDQDTANDGGPFFPSDADSIGNRISLQVRVPLYSGGSTSSRVREAVYQHRAAKERLEGVARQTERQTRDAYLGVLSEISRVNALKQAQASSETALKATEAGFEVGTRTTVDVLDARRNLFRAQTEYARSRYDYILNVLRLRQAAGILTVSDMEQINTWLK